MSIVSSIVRPIVTGGGSGTDTSDATAEQWHIKNGKDAYIVAGKVTGTGYFPAAMDFNGSTGYYSLTINPSFASGWTFVDRFRWDGGLITSAGGFSRVLAQKTGLVGISFHAVIINDETADSRAGRFNIVAQTSAPASICSVTGTDIVSDGEWHSVLAAYNPSAGTAVIKIDSNTDQKNAAATGHVLTTGTIDAASSSFRFGNRPTAEDRFFNGLGSCLGFHNAYITDWTLFFHPDGSPKNIESSLSTVFGGTPLFYHESAKMDENKGSAGAMTVNGTIVVAAASNWS
jgi:hypothetical protein